MVTEECWRLAAEMAPKCGPTVYLPYRLELGDGRAWLACRDAHQASLLQGVWRASRSCLGYPNWLWLRDDAP